MSEATPAIPIRVTVDILEERYPCLEQTAAPIPRELVSWFQKVIEPLNLNLLPDLGPPHPDADLDGEIELLLCSRESMDKEMDAEGALGLFVINTPCSDPFQEESAYARKLRTLMVIDRDELLERLRHEITEDGESWERHVWAHAEAEIATAFHELAHAVLFLKNGRGLSPHEAELMNECGEIENDLFDFCTGYGIRALENEWGGSAWAESAEEAGDMMEDWCEMQGRRMSRILAHEDLVRFFQIMDIDPLAMGAEIWPEEEEEPAGP